MSSLREEFLALDPGQKRIVHLLLCEHALARWMEFTGSHGDITYTETVCGTNQTVDAALPRDALKCAKQSRDVANVQERYREPFQFSGVHILRGGPSSLMRKRRHSR